MATVGFIEDKDGWWIAKDPNATKDYELDFGDWLKDGDALATADWTVPAPLEQVNQGLTATLAFVTIGGGVIGQTYEIVAHITTANGLIDDKSFRLVIRES